MHNHTVNASLQLVPIVQDRHPYRWVDKAIAVIQASGVHYEVNAFATAIEGTYQEVMHTIEAVNEHLNKEGCTEWILNMQIQLRSGGPVTGEEKTKPFQK